MSKEDVYVKYVLNDIPPKCECGCGEKPSFLSVNRGFTRFIQSHHNRVKGKNNFHKNPETHKKAIETQKKNWKEGKYTGWWEDKSPETIAKIEGIKEKLRNDKERAKRISEKLKGIPKTEESKRKQSETQKKRYIDNPDLGKQLSEHRIKWLKSNQSSKKTKLEIKFETILGLLDIGFIYQYEFKHRLFDFYIPTKNTLIEVDGDFYHCNPNSKYKEPIYETQIITKINDDYKTQLCKNHNITLLRYWEKDILERPEWVISDLKEKLFS
jgi:very-short-patch-repair endonuclease